MSANSPMRARLDIGRRIFRGFRGIVRIVTLRDENSRQLRSPYSFHRRQDADLVVHHDVMPGWIALLHIVEHLFLVYVMRTRPSMASQMPARSTLRG